MQVFLDITPFGLVNS